MLAQMMTRPRPVAEETDPPRVRLFGVDLDAVTPAGAVDRVCGWLSTPERRCRVVVTPNVDHLVRLHRGRDPRAWAAYRRADLITADGMPIVAASKLLGRPLPGRVTGSDLVPNLLASATVDEPFTVFLLGAAPGVADAAAEKITAANPHARVVGTHCPPLGFERDPAENARILAKLRAAKPDLLILGLGFPKQELWIDRHRDRLPVKVAVCAGATIDFLAGNVPRCPAWIGRIGLEWVYRLAREPRRLAGRYANDLVHFPVLLAREALGKL